MSTLNPLDITGKISDSEIRKTLEAWRDQLNFIINHRFGDTKSTTISTGVGSIKMSTANAATNTQWIPMYYEGTTYWIPAFATNVP